MSLRIEVISPCPEERIAAEGMLDWPVWSCEISSFPWSYGERETCLLLEGGVVVTPESGDSVRFRAGDCVVFPAGLSCHWQVLRPVRKHYRFG